MKVLRAAILAPALLIGCGHLQPTGASADLTRGDPLICEQTGDRWCIGKLWIYVKFSLNL